MQDIKYIVWDWNGTLVDDTYLFVDLMNLLLLPRNLNSLTISSYRKNFCFPLENYYLRLGFDFKKEPYSSISEEFINLYNKHKYEPPLYCGALNLIERLSSLKIKNCLLSAQQQNMLVDSVGFYGVENLFDEIVGMDNHHARGKALAAKSLINKLGADAKEVLFIGDTSMDVEMALSLGCPIIALTCGHHSRFQFKKFMSLKKISSFHRLSSYLISRFLGSL
tara:strand:- start:157 stop:822 length:666 start_codon:yes stop_codon:yes gene_type:complete